MNDQVLPGLMELEQVEENCFLGKSHEMGLHRVFGGQVLGQALAAGCRTVADRVAHSFHCYFRSFGDDRRPIRYRVDRIHDGKSFATRAVSAFQEGRCLFNMMVSFQSEEAGLEHQAPMPETVPPDDLPSLLQLLAAMEGPEHRLWRFFSSFPIEFRPVRPRNPYAEIEHPACSSVWFKSRGSLPDHRELHQAILAYASDYGLITTAGLPHGVSSSKRESFQLASLDHALWFHRNFRVDEWLLYVAQSPSASNGRGFTQGKIFSRDGRLVASVAQESLIRERHEKGEGAGAGREAT